MPKTPAQDYRPGIVQKNQPPASIAEANRHLGVARGKPGAAANHAIRRSVGEALRTLMTPEEFGEALLKIASGQDPWEKKRKKHPDGVPGLGGEAEPLRWDHRLAALKLYGEYAYGKPVQGVVVQAEIDQRLAIEASNTGPIDMRSLPPEVRAALRAAAQHALGLPAGVAEVGAHGGLTQTSGAHAASEPPVDIARPGHGTILDISETESEENGVSEASEDAAKGGTPGRTRVIDNDEFLDDSDFVSRVADKAIGIHDGDPIRLEFWRESSNLFDAELRLDVCIVRFKGQDGQPGKPYRYRNVTPAMMSAWRAAPSAGAWFAREIRAKHSQFPLVSDVPSPGLVV